MTETPLEIDVRSSQKRMAEGGVFLLDCREPEETALCCLPGATQIPMQEIPQRVGELDVAQDSSILVYCHHGVRSLHVVHWLRSQGFCNAQSMTGGIDAWSLEIDATVPRY